MSLDASNIKGGISLATPLIPKNKVQSLPPILSIMLDEPIPSCSEASWGLSVLPQGGGIFTDNAISPGSSLRQSPSRDAIRAGQNLPAKEFRYHRTVIVTAGVHRRLASELSPRRLTFRHWPGVSSYTSSCEFAGTCVFDKQSPGVMRCVRQINILLRVCERRKPLLRAYGRFFAEFLNEDSPDHFGTLTPTHLCRFTVRVANKTSIRHFSGELLY